MDIKINLKDSQIIDFEQDVSVFIGGSTGSGKTFFIKKIIDELVSKNTPNEIVFFIVDTKLIEFKENEYTSFLFKDFIYKPKKKEDFQFVICKIKKLFEDRKEFFEKEIKGDTSSNKLSFPHVFIIFDEYADFVLVQENFKQDILEILSYPDIKELGLNFIFSTQQTFSSDILDKIYQICDKKIIFNLIESKEENSLNIEKALELKTGEYLVLNK